MELICCANVWESPRGRRGCFGQDKSVSTASVGGQHILLEPADRQNTTLERTPRVIPTGVPHRADGTAGDASGGVIVTAGTRGRPGEIAPAERGRGIAIVECVFVDAELSEWPAHRTARFARNHSSRREWPVSTRERSLPSIRVALDDRTSTTVPRDARTVATPGTPPCLSASWKNLWRPKGIAYRVQLDIATGRSPAGRDCFAVLRQAGPQLRSS